MTRVAMLMTAAGLLAAACACGALAQEGEERTAEADQKALQGDWVGYFEEVGGTRFDKRQIKERNRRLAVKGNKFTMKRVVNNRLGTYEGRFELDPKAKPARFDLTGKNPGGKAVEFLGIYELKGDAFHLCYVEAGGEAKRPDEFKTEKGNGRVLLKFKREKD